MFDEGFQYSTIAGYRSALSAYHDPIDGVAIGKHPLVSSLLTGIFNKRFPQPKYTFIWDVQKVVTYLSSLDSTNISDKSLTLKLTMLLVLTSAARAHEICFLDSKYLVKHSSGYTFHFGRPTKTSNRNRIKPPMKFYPYEPDLNLCVCHHIDLYMKRTLSWRKGDSQLLVSFINPHKPVKIATISRWIMEVLSLSGIDTNTFKGHSTRSASTSKALSEGVPLKEIIKRGCWSTSTTFEKTYRKEVVGENPTQYDSAVIR